MTFPERSTRKPQQITEPFCKVKKNITIEWLTNKNWELGWQQDNENGSASASIGDSTTYNSASVGIYCHT